MNLLETLGGLALVTVLLLGAFAAGRASMPTIDHDAATTISSLEAQLEGVSA